MTKASSVPSIHLPEVAVEEAAASSLLTMDMNNQQLAFKMIHMDISASVGHVKEFPLPWWFRSTISPDGPCVPQQQ